MIVHSPETPMPEPYKTYVAQRAGGIARVLDGFVNGCDVQLCPKAILPQEAFFGSDEALVYGCVVADESQGYKSVLYRLLDTSDYYPRYLERRAVAEHGECTDQLSLVEFLAEEILREGNRVRIKDPAESDGQGQFVAETTDEA